MVSHADINALIPSLEDTSISDHFPARSSPLLPAELVVMILGYLHDVKTSDGKADKRSFISCSEVSRVWRAASLVFLYEDIELAYYDAETSQEAEEISRANAPQLRTR